VTEEYCFMTNDHEERNKAIVTKAKNILLINPSENKKTMLYEAFPSGALLLLGSMLLERGHRVKVLHLVADGITRSRLEGEIRDFGPDIIGITMSTFQTHSAREISVLAKQINDRILVVAGGPHPSALKHKILTDFPGIDVVVTGEGEHAFMEIVEGRPIPEIRGICYHGGETPPRPLSCDLDHIPLTRLDLINIKRFAGADPQMAYPTMFIMGSRGCPFQCTFCNKSIWGNSVRFRQPARIVREVEWMHEQYGIREIYFQDDTFNLRRSWTEEIFQLLIDKKLNKKMYFTTSFRANERLVDEKLLKMAKAAGFWLLFYGVESGNQQMLDSMGKGLTLNELKRAFRLTHAAGLKTKASFMIGLTGESRETFQDTIALWRELHPYVTGFGAVIPFPGTAFDREVTAKGHKLSDNYDDFSPNTIVVRTDALSAEDIARLLKEFKTLILARFFIDLLKLRYWKMIVFCLISPRYIRHILRRIGSYLKIV